MDGRARKWELRRASTIKGLELDRGPDDKPFDYDLWVVTTTFKNRKEAFRRG